MPKAAVAGAVGLWRLYQLDTQRLLPILVGRLLDATHNNYTLVFFIGAGAYVAAVIAVHFLLPRRRRDLIDSMAPAE